MKKSVVVLMNAFFAHFNRKWVLDEEELGRLFRERDDILLGSYRQTVVEKLVFGDLLVDDGDCSEERGLFSYSEESEMKPDSELLSYRHRISPEKGTFELFCGQKITPVGKRGNFEVFFKEQCLRINYPLVCSITYEYSDEFKAVSLPCVYSNGLPRENTPEYEYVEKILRVLIDLDCRYANMALLKALKDGGAKVKYSHSDLVFRKYCRMQQDNRRAQILRLYEEHLAK